MGQTDDSWWVSSHFRRGESVTGKLFGSTIDNGQSAMRREGPHVLSLRVLQAQ